MKQIAFPAATLAALLLAGTAGAMPLNAPGTTVVPAVKSCKRAEGSFRLGPTLTVSAPDKCEMALEMLGEALAGRGTSLKRVSGNADCVFVLAEGFAPEAYKLEIAPAGIRITASTDRGLFYGAQTLIPMIRGAGNDNALAACVIDDRPDLKVRGMQFTLRYLDSQNLPDFKRMVRALASLKYNTLLLEFADNFPYADNPFTLRKSSITKDELRELVDWITAHKIEIIPQVQLISHVRALSTHPRFKEFLEAPTKLASLHDAAYCPSNPEVNELMKKMIREQLEFFKPKVFDVSFDEIADCPFRVCPKCKARQAEEILLSQLDMAAKLIFGAGATPQLYQDSFLPGKVGRGEFVIDKLDRRYRVVHWGYTELPQPLFRIFKNKGFPTITMPLAGDPVNTAAMVRYAKNDRIDGVILAFWYHWMHRGPKLLPITAAGYGGLVVAGELCWNAEADRTLIPCDTVQEMRFRLGFGGNTTASGFKALPIAAAVNAKLGSHVDFPLFRTPERLEKLKAEAAAAPEHFELLTDGNNYYGMLLAGSPKDPNQRHGMLIGVNAKVKEFAFLLTASRPANTTLFIPRGKYGVHSTPKVATLTLEYADGSKHTTELDYRKSIVDWASEFGGLDMRLLQRDADDRGFVYNFGVFTLVNPKPDQTVKTITFSTKRECGIAPLLLAVSAVADRDCAPQKINPARLAVTGGGAEVRRTEFFDAAVDKPSRVKVRLILNGKPESKEFFFRNRLLKAAMAQDADGAPVLRFTAPALTKGTALQRVIVQIPVKGIDVSNKSVHWKFRVSDPAGHKYYGIFVGAPRRPGFPHIAYFDHSRVPADGRSGEIGFADMRQEKLRSVADAEDIWLSFWLVNEQPLTVDVYRVGVSDSEGKFQSPPIKSTAL